MYRIEFIGIPGSGKTTIRKKLLERFKHLKGNNFLSVEEAILDVSREKIDKVYRIILNILPKGFALIISDKLLNRNRLQHIAQNRFLAQWGKSFEIYLGSAAYDNTSIDDRKLLIDSYLHTGSMYECINGDLSDKTVVFFEEGLVQRSFMFISPSINEEADESSLYAYLDSIPLPDLVVYVNADLSVCYERMIQRTDGLTDRLGKTDKNGILNFLETSQSHLQNVVSRLQKNKDINIIEINNEQKIDNVVSDLEKRVKDIVEKDIAGI